MSEFKKNNTFVKRRDEANRILDKYPDRIPIIIENYPDCDTLEKLEKNKYTDKLKSIDSLLLKFLL